MRARQPCVYILASGYNGTLYVWVTSDLLARLVQHREGLIAGFTSRYDVKRLVYWEVADTMDAAIAREKQLKRWRREWKCNLIERENPTWDDLVIGLGLEPLGYHTQQPWTPEQVRGDEGKKMRNRLPLT